MLALVALAKAGIAHGDLKGSNIMVTAFDNANQPMMYACAGAAHYFTIKLIDFGSGQKCTPVRHHALLIRQGTKAPAKVFGSTRI